MSRQVNYPHDLIATFDAPYDRTRVYQFVRRHCTPTRRLYEGLAEAALRGENLEREFHKVRAMARFVNEERRLASQRWLATEPVLEGKQ